jgi:ribosome-binding factor A
MSHRSSRRAKVARRALRLGADPDLLLPGASSGSFDRKTRQLCEQVFEALSLALAESDDAHFADAFVVAVEPAPDASRLCVVVAVDARAAFDEVLGALEQRRGWLRAQIAADIHRKRAPELCFAVTPR